MNKWPIIILRDVAIVRSGAGFPLDKQGFLDQSIPFFKVGDMNRPGNETEMHFFQHSISEKTRNELGAYLLPTGTVIFPKVGAAIGTNKKRILVRPSCVDNNVMGIIPKEHLTTGFLYALLLSKNIMDFACNSNPPSIRKTTVEDWQVPIPPIPEQERIVKLLDEADELRKLRVQADRRIAALIPALFQEMFGNPANNPFGWNVESVGTLFNHARGGAKCGPFGSALKKHEYVGVGIPVWGIPNVLPNKFIEAGSLFISPQKFDELSAYAVEPGDLLFSRAGTVGRICVAKPTSSKSITGTNLIRLALDQTKVSPDFFSALLTYFAKDVGRLRANIDEGAYSFMNTTVLKTLRIYVPPITLQKGFAQRVKDIRELEASQATSRTRLDALFQSMLHRAFNGEL